jgi:hypothetical protein
VKLYKLAQEAREDYTKEDTAGALQRSTIIFRGGEIPMVPISSAAHSEPPVFDDHSPSASMSFDRNFDDNRGGLNNDAGTPSNEHGNKIHPLPVVKVEEEEKKEDDAFKVPEESKVGKKLSELTTKRVIILVLGMMFGLPLFTVDLYEDENTSYQFGLELMVSFVGQPEEFKKAWDIYLDEHEDIDTPLVYLEVKFRDKYEADTKVIDLRAAEQVAATLEGADTDDMYSAVAVFDTRKNS